MKKDMTLLVLAAGMGSRFGGLKQIEPFGPSNEFIIDYSIYDAIKAGFNKVVFVIKEENYEIFKDTVGSRIEPHVQVEYCFQDINNLPNGYNAPEGRIKPWGTAHAILSAKDKIHENFAIINADDFYGREAYYDVAKFLQNTTDENEYVVIGYEVEHTLTEHGSVKRAVLQSNGELLTKLIESNIEKNGDEIVASPLNGATSFKINKDSSVSMNMFGFSSNLFKYIEENFPLFLEENRNNIDKCEYLIPDLLTKLMDENKISIKVIPTKAKWQGVTYKEDKPKVVERIETEIKNGIYGKDLWKS